MLRKSSIGLVIAVALFGVMPAAAQNVPLLNVAVNCGGGQKIQGHLNNKTRARRLIITITGTCNENLKISRDDVIIKGPTPGQRNATITGSIIVTGSTRIELLHLKVLAGPDFGITVKRGSSVFMKNIGVSGHPQGALAIVRASVVQLENSTLGSPPSTPDATIQVVDNSVLQMERTTVFANGGGFNAVIGVYRSGAVRIRGAGSTIVHNGAPQADESTAAAIAAYDNSNVRVQDSGHTITGNIAISDGSTADLRDNTINGNVFAHRMSLIEFRNTSNIIGTVRSGTRSLIDYKGATQTGTASCFQDGAVRGKPASVTATNCVEY